jgi:MoxR-like ATPase
MTNPNDLALRFHETFERLVTNVSSAVLGKEQVVRLALTCLLSEGHLLIEDLPGTGKTSLAKAIANTIQGSSARIQFTPDLLPSDVTGVQIYDQSRATFEFKHGPIFHSIVLADEINRASPKTQAALLEVMEENQVTIDGRAYPVGRPFMVIATQNPIEHHGTYALPEAQLDRFLMKTSIGFPDAESMVAVLGTAAVRDRAAAISPVIVSDAVRQLSEFADHVTVRTEILRYVTYIAEASRAHPALRLGVSTRGCLAFIRCAKTWAAAHGRAFVLPDDIVALARPIMEHRLLLTPDAQIEGVTIEQVIKEIFHEIAPPQGRA